MQEASGLLTDAGYDHAHFDDGALGDEDFLDGPFDASLHVEVDLVRCNGDDDRGRLDPLLRRSGFPKKG